MICPYCNTAIKNPLPSNTVCTGCARKFNVSITVDTSHYVEGIVKTPSGRKSLDIDDDISQLLRGGTINQTLLLATHYLIAEISPEYWFSTKNIRRYNKHIITQGIQNHSADIKLLSFLTYQYGNLSTGICRMQIGNLLRYAITRQKSGKKHVLL